MDPVYDSNMKDSNFTGIFTLLLEHLKKSEG